MKKRVIIIVFCCMMLLIGCSDLGSNQDMVIAITDENSVDDVDVAKEIGEITSANDLYASKSIDIINYDKLNFVISPYTVKKRIQKGNTIEYECAIDKENSRPISNFYISIKNCNIKGLGTVDEVLAYIKTNYSDFANVTLYINVTDTSGIDNLYKLSNDISTMYLISNGSEWYLVESNHNALEIYLFKNISTPYPRYKRNIIQVECANNNSSIVEVAEWYENNNLCFARYDILQSISENKLTGIIERNKESNYKFELVNEYDEILLQLATYGEFNDIINFLDVNMDGFMDIVFLKEPGTFNNSYELFIWENSMDKFKKVECNEMLSNIKVYNGYILNTVRENVTTSIIQKFIWVDNTLVKDSEERYSLD